MAQRTQLILECDVNGCESGKDVQTLTFGWTGRDFEVELCDTHRGRAEKAIVPLTEYGRRVGGSTAPTRARNARTPQPKHDRAHLEAVRTWARANGYEVSDRGRIKGTVMDAYQEAHRA